MNTELRKKLCKEFNLPPSLWRDLVDDTIKPGEEETEEGLRASAEVYARKTAAVRGMEAERAERAGEVAKAPAGGK